jgi:hypothetical protein
VPQAPAFAQHHKAKAADGRPAPVSPDTPANHERVEDYSALRYLRESVSGTSLCEEIDLVADPDDPKDLFGFALAPSLVG